MSEQDNSMELKCKLDQAKRLLSATEDPATRSHLMEMARELERRFEIAAQRENPE